MVDAASWDRRQELYIGRREERFDTVLDARLHALGLAHRALRPGGLLLDADHLGFATGSSFDRHARWVADADDALARAAGAPAWDEWWAAARAGFAEVDTIWQRADDRVVMAVKGPGTPG